MWKIVALVSGLIAAVLVADFYGVFGSRIEGVPDYMHLTFQFVDADTRTSIDGVHVACTRPMARSVCSETQGPGAGQTTITFSAYRKVRRGFVFSADAGYSLGPNGVMYLTFVSPNHERSLLEIIGDDPILSAQKPHAIVLTRMSEP